MPSRALYGAKVGNDGRFYVARRADWECRMCAKLRYSSEGGYLRPGKQFRAFGNFPRPELWLPYVFTSPQRLWKLAWALVYSPKHRRLLPLLNDARPLL